VNKSSKADGIDRAPCIAVEWRDDLHDADASEPLRGDNCDRPVRDSIAHLDHSSCYSVMHNKLRNHHTLRRQYARPTQRVQLVSLIYRWHCQTCSGTTAE